MADIQRTTSSGTSPLAGPSSPERRQVVQFKAHQIVYYVLALLETLLAFRFFLYLFGASSVSGFVSFVYSVSDVFMAPFAGIFPTFVEGEAVFEWPVLVAMFVYALIAWGIVALIRIIVARRPSEQY